MTAYYNEHDPFAAAWLRELIKANLIAPGIVDERSIEDVKPDDLKEFTQCHFFAGIGVWSYALRLAGWPDDEAVWTGSCPCQPFSQAGRRRRNQDERHLWPAWRWLISQSKPRVIFGEQVAGADGITWLDAVSTELEAEGYAIGSVVLPACGVGAPHIRQRTFFVAYAESIGRGQGNQDVRRGVEGSRKKQRAGSSRSGRLEWVADLHSEGSQVECEQQTRRQFSPSERSGEACGLVNTDSARSGRDILAILKSQEASKGKRLADRSVFDFAQSTGATCGFWKDAEWLDCIDGKYRPVEPGTFPLAHGASARVGRVRGYGNAINAEVAKEFIKAAKEVIL